MKHLNLWLVVIAVAVILLLSLSLTYLYLEQRSALTVDSFNSTPQIGQYTIEYPTQPHSTAPNAITLDSSGDVWFTLGNVSSIAELIPSNGTIHEYHLPGMKNGGLVSWGLVIDNYTSTAWFTDFTSNSVWSFDMISHQFTQHKLTTVGALPFGIAIDQDQNIWFTELAANKIGEISHLTGGLSEIPIPVSGTPAPSGITISPTGVVWFTMPDANSVGEYANGSFTIDNLTAVGDEPVGISMDHSGNLWMTQHGGSLIMEFNPVTHYVMTFSTSNNSLVYSLPYFCYVDRAGNVWINEHQGNAEAEFVPSSGTLIEYFIPSVVPQAGNISYMLTSTVSPSGQPWYTEFETGKVGTINITSPLDVNLSLLNYTGPISLSDNGVANLKLSEDSGSHFMSFKAYVGNYTGNFTFTFSPNSGSGTLASSLHINVNSSPPGVYFVTVTARTGTLAVSKIIELKVQ
jgi:virginiamycin B lyase